MEICLLFPFSQKHQPYLPHPQTQQVSSTPSNTNTNSILHPNTTINTHSSIKVWQQTRTHLTQGSLTICAAPSSTGYQRTSLITTHPAPFSSYQAGQSSTIISTRIGHAINTTSSIQYPATDRHVHHRSTTTGPSSPASLISPISISGTYHRSAVSNVPKSISSNPDILLSNFLQSSIHVQFPNTTAIPALPSRSSPTLVPPPNTLRAYPRGPHAN
jgi:hypothetical protein